jgi:hypothetical protein
MTRPRPSCRPRMTTHGLSMEVKLPDGRRVYFDEDEFCAVFRRAMHLPPEAKLTAEHAIDFLADEERDLARRLFATELVAAVHDRKESYGTDESKAAG